MVANIEIIRISLTHSMVRIYHLLYSIFLNAMQLDGKRRNNYNSTKKFQRQNSSINCALKNG